MQNYATSFYWDKLVISKKKEIIEIILKKIKFNAKQTHKKTAINLS